MTRIENKFAQLRAEGRKAFIPYLTAGDPSLETTRQLVLALEKAGADIIELGVPFSDPIADGPIIQRATERALSNGVTLHKILELGQNIRRTSGIPLVLFSYFNPLLNYGLERLAKDAVKAGFDGVLASELKEFLQTLRTHTTAAIAVGFGTSRPEHVRAVWQEADGVVVGSSIVKEVEQNAGKPDLVEKV